MEITREFRSEVTDFVKSIEEMEKRVAAELRGSYPTDVFEDDDSEDFGLIDQTHDEISNEGFRRAQLKLELARKALLEAARAVYGAYDADHSEDERMDDLR